MQSTTSTRIVWFLDKREQFDTYTCEYDTQKCNNDTFERAFYTKRVISTRIVNLTHTKMITQLTAVISTRTIVISTRRVWFWNVWEWLWHSRVWIRHARVWILHECDFHNMRVMLAPCVRFCALWVCFEHSCVWFEQAFVWFEHSCVWFWQI
jgi:hypothetical protein